MGFVRWVGICTLATTWAAGAQTGGSPHVRDAKREYAAVFAHLDNPCTWTDNVSYLECMVKEIAFTEGHLDAWMAAMRAMAADWDSGTGPGSRKILDSLNKTDMAWREYRKNACSLQFDTFQGGTGGAPAEQECELRLDRAYMKMLADFVNLPQMA